MINRYRDVLSARVAELSDELASGLPRHGLRQQEAIDGLKLLLELLERPPEQRWQNQDEVEAKLQTRQ